jgi:hypothetical protein
MVVDRPRGSLANGLGSYARACYPNNSDAYVSLVANIQAGICNAVESRYEYMCDFNDAKIFRKRR